VGTVNVDQVKAAGAAAQSADSLQVAATAAQNAGEPTIAKVLEEAQN